MLSVKGNQIVDEDGKEVLLRGAGLGGWMNMENFITGYPGHEIMHRAAMKEVLGEEKYEYFFDKFLEYFFTEADAVYFKKCGLNCIRIPINYRHFEDDMNPRVLKPQGFKHLDRLIDICSKHEIYTVIDLHALPGGQNNDWHADNLTNHAHFWDHKDFQERGIWMWEQLAAKYKGNRWIAGYNPMNEPCDPQGVRLVKWMNQCEKAIRKVDPDHILFWDGNTWAADFTQFEAPLLNSVYACHDYTTYGFPLGETFVGSPEQKDKLKRSFQRKIGYMKEHNVPIWNGEWGPVYANERQDGPEYNAINKARFFACSEQLKLYDEERIHWSIWTYKDIGFQGMVSVSPDSPWIKRLQSWLDFKRNMALDEWGCSEAPVKHIFDPLEKWIIDNAPEVEGKYPKTWRTKQHLMRVTRNTLVADCLQMRFAENFRNCSFEELDALARSFHMDQCVERKQLTEMLSAHAH